MVIEADIGGRGRWVKESREREKGREKRVVEREIFANEVRVFKT